MLKYRLIIFFALLVVFFSTINSAIANSSPMSSFQKVVQEKKVTLSIENKSIREVLVEIRKQTAINFVLNSDVAEKVGNVTVKMKNATIHEVLTEALKGTGYEYKLGDNYISIIKTVNTLIVAKTAQPFKINGLVVDKKKAPVVGATIFVQGTGVGAITDANGAFQITVKPNQKVEVSFVGMVTQVITIDQSKKDLIIELKSDIMSVDNVYVISSSYFRKTKQSNTGAEVRISGDDLRNVGSLNMLQAISVFDPSVRSIANNEFGSDPNRLPEITIRGENGFDLRSSADDARSNPNSPMYILDGLEVTATRVYDLDMNRIESFSILKDAAATSLYGSRGANGVIVIQTVRPRQGEVRVTVNTSFNISIPDLRDYNLMNAEEKLLYEQKANVYVAGWGKPGTQDQLDHAYNEKLKEIKRGVDTYWLSQPLRTSLNQRYNSYIEGGDGSFRYGITLKYDNDNGVMKGSSRDKIGASFNFNYNIKEKFYIINDVSINDVKGENSAYGSLSQYGSMNPYYRIYDDNTGDLIRKYDYMLGEIQANPLYDASLPFINYDKYTEIEDNLSLDWRINNHFRVNGRIGLIKKISKTENYRSPYSTQFDRETDVNKKGSYVSSNMNEINVDGNFTASYNNTFQNHITLSAGVGANMTTANSVGEGFTATGFLNDNLTSPQFAQQFKDGSKPSGSFDKSRMIGFFTNVNIGYKNRYFVDGSFRTDGSSRFGRNSRFAPFWSFSGAWNLNNEEWWKDKNSTMKLRASVGSTGTVNFSSDQAITKYEYGPKAEYNGVYGALLMGYGNPSLKWQNTLQYNVGLDMSIWKNIIILNVDAYLKETQNLLLPIDVAPSTGFLSYTENLGSMENRGVEFRLRFNILKDRARDLDWNVTFAGFHNTNEIKKLSNALEAMNKEANDIANAQKPTPLRTYQAGRSQSALMVVESMGIDPATGNEIYRKLDGSLTFDYDAKDKIIVGDTNPKFEGNLQSNLTFKGFNIFFVLAYQFGSVSYNSTLAQKVEGSSPKYNADKRVLHNRWKEPGDVVMFRRIDDMSSPYQSTRLVQKNNFVRLQSLSLSYQVPDQYLKNSFLERAKIVFNTSDLFRIATIKQERGTSYPFAQTFSVGVNLTF